MEKEKKNSAKSFSMNGGDGPNSYLKNSSYQRGAVDGAKGMIREAIEEKLHISSSSPSDTIYIADLGCSVGQNTFIAIQNIVEAIERKSQSQGLGPQTPEFQVFFSDQVSNDFNKLFTSLPPQRQYFAAAVPGSFYNRLFPKQSLHFIYCSYSLQWLSKVPKEVEDMNSPAWNKGRIHYVEAQKEVVDAYFAQFVKDMESFLSARSQELLSGGLMALILPTYTKEMLSIKSFRRPLDILGSCLMEMSKKGIVSEAKVDSFNVPVYSPSSKELEEVIKNTGYFSIERLELLSISKKYKAGPDAKTFSMHIRAGLEGIIDEHFGREIIDELFVLFARKVAEYSHIYNSENRVNEDLFVILCRK
ncbi:hypothetical protein IFM89_033329 [Coptis chinensis]|uniref:S-adenosylmethionine-dependent methyltransferase At5g38100 n=1 Tax=Coptis chinensis TaxID=261450 RepID=A0A835HIJ9_9MAGN|nr:hypothetical protein IFM89_033329 [Coptis chinensis]